MAPPHALPASDGKPAKDANNAHRANPYFMDDSGDDDRSASPENQGAPASEVEGEEENLEKSQSRNVTKQPNNVDEDARAVTAGKTTAVTAAASQYTNQKSKQLSETVSTTTSDVPARIPSVEQEGGSREPIAEKVTLQRVS